MFKLNVLGEFDPLYIYISAPDGRIIGNIDNFIDEENSSLTVGLNQQYELSITVDGTCPWFELIQDGMYLYLDKIGLFRMDEPELHTDGTKSSKSIVARSSESELEDKSCKVNINMGTETSQEFLVTYTSTETEQLLNPYTGIPYDWIVLYNTFPEQLTDELAKVRNGHYGSKSDGEIRVTSPTLIAELEALFRTIPRLKNKIQVTKDTSTGLDNYNLIEYVSITYDANSNIQSITLLSAYESRIQSLINFYTRYRNQLSLLSIVLENTNGAWTIGDIYGVSNKDYTLANKKFQFEVDENIYSFLTNSLAEASNCIVSFDNCTRKVNVTPADAIGSDTGIVMSYESLLNELSISYDDNKLTTRLKISSDDELTIDQVNFGSPYVDDLSYKLNARDKYGNRIYVTDALAEKYMAYVTKRNSLRSNYIELSKEYNKIITEISELKYRVPNDILKTDWNTFSLEELTNSLTTYNNLLYSLIALYKNDYGSSAVNADGTPKESFIRQTIYWYDYSAYVSIINEIKCAIDTFPFYSNQEKWTAENINKYKELITAWETEWSLYGIIELQAKISSYKQNMDILAESSVIRKSSSSEDIKKWSELSVAEKNTFGGLSLNYYYDVYMEYYNNKTSASNYLTSLQSSLANLERRKQQTADSLLAIRQDVLLENNFTYDECEIINRLYTDSEFSTDDIVITSVDTYNTKMDKMQELLLEAEDKLSAYSRPQLTFSVSCENLFALKDMAPLWDSFIPGNYILVQYNDDTYIKLRIVGYTFNPSLPKSPELQITFSNFIRSKVQVSDLESLLGKSGSSGISSKGSSGSSGVNIEDFDNAITNTLLSKLLSSETFGTKVRDVILDTINVKSITAKYAQFDGLSSGTTIIDGGCITTGYIKDKKYNGSNGSITNTLGSVINLENGNFSFAGGKLKWDGTNLSVTGNITATTGKIGNWVINSTSIYYGNSAFGNAGGMYLGTSGLSLGDKLKYNASNNTLSFGAGVKLEWSNLPTDVASSGSIPTDVSQLADSKGQKWSTTVGENFLKTTNVIAQNLVVNAAKINGTITANQIDATNLKVRAANITGTVTANQIDSTGLVADDIRATNIRGKTIIGSTIKMFDLERPTDMFTMEDGRVYSQSWMGYKVWITDDGVAHTYSLGARFDHGEVNTCASGSTLASQSPNPGYQSRYNAFGIDWEVRGTDGEYNPLFFISTQSNDRRMYCNIQATFGRPTFFSNTIYDKNGSVISGSDANIKNSISSLNIEKSANFIYSLNPVEFKYNEGTSDRLHHGLIAQEVKQSMGDDDWGVYVDINEDDEYYAGEAYKGLRYSELSADIIATLQLQNERIKELEEMINELKEK